MLSDTQLREIAEHDTLNGHDLSDDFTLSEAEWQRMVNLNLSHPVRLT